MMFLREFCNYLRPAMIGPVVILMFYVGGVIVPKDYKFGLGMGLIVLFFVGLAAVMAHRSTRKKG